MRLLTLIAILLVALLTAAYVAADAAGLAGEDAIAARLQALHADPSTRRWAAPTVVGLLAADLVLPVPSSVVMTASGAVLGAVTGTAASFTGAMIAALTGFTLCRRLGRRAFTRVIGPRDTEAVAAFLEHFGAWAILLSRSVPMVTEVISCLAGLGPMRWQRFAWLSAAGTLPVCTVYAVAGAVGRASDQALAVALLVALGVPALAFAGLRRHRRFARPAVSAPTHQG